MFNTTLTNEYLACVVEFGWSKDTIRQLAMNAVHVALLPAEDKQRLVREFTSRFNQLIAE